jgi:hypothetical protein
MVCARKSLNITGHYGARTSRLRSSEWPPDRSATVTAAGSTAKDLDSGGHCTPARHDDR